MRATTLRYRNLSWATLLVCLLTLALAPAWAFASSFDALYLSATGWVEPGETFPMTLEYDVDAGETGTISLVLSEYTVFVSASATSTGTGTSLDPLVFSGLTGSGKIIVQARALDLLEEPTMVWRDLSASATFSTGTTTIDSTTLGPKCTELETARFGVRRFPLVMVEYQDVTHCTAEGQPFPECTGEHTAEKLDFAVNSRTSGASLWQLFQDMSFGQLSPEGQVGPAPNTADAAYDPSYPYKWSTLQPAGTCTGVTTAPPSGQGVPASTRGRIEDGWYVLPGTQNYYGADATGHGLVGFVSGGLLLNIDDACGPTGKIAYDAAAIADQDLDYNDFDSDRDGLVDFMNVAFAGDGGNGNTSVTGINNVWPHKSDLQYYFTDDNGERGYVSNDQLRNHVNEPMFWADSSREVMTTTNTGIPVYVRVGPYNVNPESAIDAVSVVAHEYGHSLGLPDFYSLGNRETFGSWELMASDHFQFMSVFTRQEMGWIVPRTATDGVHTLRESKIDTGEILWQTPDGTPYTLTGAGIHNADALRVDLPKVLVIEEVPSGTRAFHSGAGNEFGCAPEAGHNLDIFLPELKQHSGASSIELSFQSLYEIEWDWDFAFLLASTDGINWQALPSLENTTLDGFNPNGWECYDRYGNGITGVSRQATNERNLLTNSDRATGTYREAQWITDRFDLTQFAGEDLILRFSYFTDPAAVKRGWFIDDFAVSVDGSVEISDDFEDTHSSRRFSDGWAHVNTSTGADTDHAYFFEMRDRVSNDFDSKGQSDRGAPTWQPGVAVLYTDENHGYGNTGVSNPPAQTILDSVPSPGNDSPNLDDAAFVAEAGRDVFDACTHIDNYDNPAGDDPDGYWKVPEGVRMTVAGISGLSSDGVATGNASADLWVDVEPDCSILQVAPTITFGAGHQDPDPNGSYELTWTRPNGATGPDVLQEATVLADLFSDDAEAGLANWVADTYTDQCGSAPGDFVEWQQNSGKFQSAAFSFFTAATEAAYGSTCADFHSTLTLASALSVPSEGGTVLSFWDSIGGELDDKGLVEVSADGGATWVEVYQTANPIFADAAVEFAEEPLHYKEVDLTQFAGSDILVRFNYTVGASNYIAYTPIGWWVDDITISTANWTTLSEVDGTNYLRSGLGDGTYHYRVATLFPGVPFAIESPWSNVITTQVVRTENSAPVAVNDSANTNEGTPVTVDVLANDSDPDGDPMSVSGVSQPGNGTATLNADQTVTYTPDAGFVGNDAFTYAVTDSQGATSYATVSISVQSTNTAPSAVNDYAVTDEDTAVTVAVLGNDSDPDGDNLTVSSTSQPAHGGANINADGTVTYTPDAGFFGTDAFTYTISDGRGGQSSATVSVDVRATGDGGGGDGGDRDDDDSDGDGDDDDSDDDDDNDGVHDDDDDDDDGDGIEDDFDDRRKKDKKSKRSDDAAPNTSTSYLMRVEQSTLLLTAVVDSPQAADLLVTIHSPNGTLLGTSVNTGLRSVAAGVPLGAGDYVVTVTNNGTQSAAFDLSLFQRVPWPALP